MTGPGHYRKAEEPAAKAHEYRGQGDGQASAAIWTAVAHIQATLAPSCCHRARNQGCRWPRLGRSRRN